MAETNKRNLVDETAKVYAENTLANNPTPLFSTGLPAKIMRASIANTNLLSEDGDLFVGTGDTYTETIDGIEYTYAKIAKKNQSKLFVDGLNSTATNVGLAASVGEFIDSRLHISNSTAKGTGSIALGYNAKTTNDQAVAIGYEAIATGGSTAIGNGAKISTAITNAIQLGSGTNSTMNSFQVGSHQMLNLSTGKIPWDRINQTGGNSTLALGGTVTMAGDTVYGANSAALNGYGVAIGASAKSVYSGDVAVGYDSYCRGGANVTIGYQASVGRGNEYGAQDCIAIGGYAAVSTKNGAVTKSIQLGIGTNTSGGLKVFDWQLLDWQGVIPIDRMPALQYRHNLTLSAKDNGIQDFYLSFNIITNDATSFGGDYSGNGADDFLENLSNILATNGYGVSDEFKLPCIGYDISNGTQMMWLSGDNSKMRYYYIQNNSIQSRMLSMTVGRNVIHVKDDIIAGFKL